MSYLRFISKQGGIRNSFVMEKLRVKPLKSGVRVEDGTESSYVVDQDKLAHQGRARRSR